jgi:hypothetical protein
MIGAHSSAKLGGDQLGPGLPNPQITVKCDCTVGDAVPVAVLIRAPCRADAVPGWTVDPRCWCGARPGHDRRTLFQCRNTSVKFHFAQISVVDDS